MIQFVLCSELLAKKGENHWYSLFLSSQNIQMPDASASLAALAY